MASSFNILIGIWRIRYFFFTFCPAIIWTWETSIEDWKIFIRWCRTDICSCRLFEKVSFMLENPFLVPSLCKLNDISVYFIQISTKSPADTLFTSMFFSCGSCGSSLVSLEVFSPAQILLIVQTTATRQWFFLSSFFLFFHPEI